MKITFLGTGTSMGVPVAGGFGRDKMGPDPRNSRMRCSLWIQSDTTSLLIDAGPEFRLQSLRASLRDLDAILITHEHMDHVSGLDDVRPYTYEVERPIPVYGPERVLRSIEARFDYMFGSNRYPGATNVTLRVAEGSSFNIGDLHITPLPVLHGDLPIYGYRIGKLAYMTDLKTLPEETYDLLEGCEVIIMGALRWQQSHPTHATIDESLQIVARLNAKEIYFIHMNGSVDQTVDQQKLPKNVRFAFDQQVLWV